MKEYKQRIVDTTIKERLSYSCGTFAAENPWRFSSEYVEDDTATVYYNYRHYDPGIGRWLSVDLIEDKDLLQYGFVNNSPIMHIDRIGLYGNPVSGGGQIFPNRPNNWGWNGAAYEKCPDGAKTAGTDLGDGTLSFYRTNIDNGHKKDQNGCGAKGGQGFPNSYPPRPFLPLVDFKGCCNAHDVCYGTCGRNRSECDQGLGACMRQKCEESLRFVYHEKALCVSMATAYELAVATFGDGPFEAGQDEGCIWKPCCKHRK